MSIDFSESAFPREFVMNGETGMTLRDYFAAKVAQAAITGLAMRGETFSYSDAASLAYEVADAMMKERVK